MKQIPIWSARGGEEEIQFLLNPPGYETDGNTREAHPLFGGTAMDAAAAAAAAAGIVMLANEGVIIDLNWRGMKGAMGQRG